MKLSAKLYVLIAFLFAAFVAVVVYLGAAWMQSRGLYDLQRHALHTARDVYAMTEQQMSLLTSTEALAESLEQWDGARSTFEESLARLSEHRMLDATGQQARQLLEQTNNVWDYSHEKITNARETLRAITQNNQIPRSFKQGIGPMLDNEGLSEYVGEQTMSDLVTARRDLQSVNVVTRDTLVQNLDYVVNAVERRVEALQERTLLTAAGIFVAVLAIGIFVMLRFSRSLTRRVQSLESIMSRMAELDLTGEVSDPSRDEIGMLCRHTNTVLESIREFMRTVRGASDELGNLQDNLAQDSESAGEKVRHINKTIQSIREQFAGLDDHLATISNSVKEISDRVGSLNNNIESQSSAIEESSASIEEFSSSIENVAKLANDRRARAEELAGLTGQAGDRVASTNEVISGISEKIDDILEIIQIINGISEQTDLLSMNAAIESAHAGEAGKGFAVVAEEIRKLAESTSENAAQIDEALRWITTKIREALDSSSQSQQTVEEINADIQSFSDAMTEISQSMDELRTGSREIMESSGEIRRVTTSVKEGSETMGEATENIRSAMEEVTSVSSTVRNNVEEIAGGSAEVLESVKEIGSVTGNSRRQMARLGELVDSFKTETDGEEPGEATSGAARSGDAGGEVGGEAAEEAGVTQARPEDVAAARDESSHGNS
mgnify:CR=1 FL=1